LRDLRRFKWPIEAHRFGADTIDAGLRRSPHLLQEATVVSVPPFGRSPVELASGIDALYMSARGAVPDVLLSELDLHKNVARQRDEPVDINLGGYPLRVIGTGWGKYRYCLLHELARVGITPSEKLPAIRVQPTARALHTIGPETTVLWVRNLLDAFGVESTLQVSRLDLHSDWQGFWIEPNERSNFVTYSDKRALYEVGDALSGLNFGKRGGALYARLYDKTREAEGKGHDWWPDVWGPGFDPEQPVLRVEFEINRDGLREFGILSPEDAFENLGPLWAYSTSQWLTLRIPTADDTRSRWPIDPRWQAVQRCSLSGNALPADRMRAGAASGELRRMLPQLVGYLASAALPLGTTDLDSTLAALRPHVEAYGQRRSLSFDDRVAEKRRRA